MKILGVDPGGTGALALLQDNGRTLDVRDMPSYEVARGRGKKREIDVRSLAGIIREWRPDACFFEQVHGMEGDSPSTSFNFGRASGVAEALIKIEGGQFRFVAPHKWKKAMGLIGKQKDDSRRMASDLWPDSHDMFRRKLDHNRADAALIAEFGRRDLVTLGVFQ